MELSALAGELDQRIPSLLIEHSLPGLAIGIVHGSASWTAGYGVTRSVEGKPVGPETMFSVQSMSKTFTAIAVLAAVRDGLLDLDVPVSTYLPDFAVHSRFQDRPQDRMTLRHLLSHTAGFTHEAPVGSNFASAEASFDDHLDSITQTWLRFPVGAGYEYSNLGIDLAGQILATVRGRDFPACVRDSVFAPARMDRSSFDFAEIKADADRAIGHDADLPEVPVAVPMLAAGGMYSCVRDLVSFVQADLDGKLLPADLAAEMQKVPFPVAEQSGGYGLGLGILHGGGLDGDGWIAYTHNGSGFGFRADIVWEPATRTGVVILTNSVDHPLQGVLSIELLNRLAGRDPKSPAVSVPVTRGSATLDRYGRFLGEYVGRSFAITLAEQDGYVVARMGSEAAVPVHKLDGDLLTEPIGFPFPLRFRAVESSSSSGQHLLALHDGSMLMYNAAPQPPSPQTAFKAGIAAARRAGDYQIRTFGPHGIPARLELNGGRLWLAVPDLTGVPRLRLDPHDTIDSLYFTSTGEAVDLRAEPPTFASLPLIRAE